jgi:predicted signal transduction protein with EAL and GGDEF domain
VYIFRGSLIPQIARVVISLLIIVILLVPAVFCLMFTTMKSRMLTIVVGIGCFIVSLAGFTRAKPVEIAVAGAT